MIEKCFKNILFTSFFSNDTELLRLPHSSITNAALDKRYLNQRIMMSRPRQKPNKNSQKIFRPRNFQKSVFQAFFPDK